MAKINIKGAIVSNNHQGIYDFFGIEAISPNIVTEEMEKANGEALEVDINSGGGDVFAGSEIYTALKSYGGDVTTRIVGVAASAASVIAMAGKKVLMSPTAQIMIHNVSSYTAGDHRDMQHEADVLKNYNKTIANAYRIKSGLDESKLLDMMNKETWLTSEQAIELGFIDEVMFENEVKLVASFDRSAMLPPEVINKIRNMQHPPVPKKENKVDFLMQQKAKLQFLNLRGKQL